MEALRSFVLIIAGLIASVLFGVLVMIHGWGLVPQSYWWIVVIGVSGQLLAQILIKLSTTK